MKIRSCNLFKEWGLESPNQVAKRKCAKVGSIAIIFQLFIGIMPSFVVNFHPLLIFIYITQNFTMKS
jgi:hypothetical protein